MCSGDQAVAKCVEFLVFFAVCGFKSANVNIYSSHTPQLMQVHCKMEKITCKDPLTEKVLQNWSNVSWGSLYL